LICSSSATSGIPDCESTGAGTVAELTGDEKELEMKFMVPVPRILDCLNIN
jgi:hypothetical protein